MLAFVNEAVAVDGIAPSYDMIVDALGISNRSKVSDIVKRLERRGLLSRVGGARCPKNVHGREARRIALSIR